MTLKPFIEWDGDQQGPPPYTFEDVELWGFPMLGDPDKLQNLVDRFLNDPLTATEIEARPWTVTERGTGEVFGVVYLLVLRYGRMRSDRWKSRGYLSQCELCYSIPVSRFSSRTWYSWALFTPYLFVDNPWSSICGNTVMGYPKASAGFQIGEEGGSPYPISVEALAYREFSPSGPATVQPLLEISARSEAPLPGDPLYWPIGPFETLFGENGPWRLDTETYANVLETLVPGPQADQLSLYTAMQLKQIRDAEDPSAAAVQVVYDYDVELQAFNGAGFLWPANVRIRDTASWPIADTLGLNPSSTCWVPYWLGVDYSMGTGCRVSG